MKKVILVSIGIAFFVGSVQAAAEASVWQTDAQVEQKIWSSMRDRERIPQRFGQDRYPRAGFGRIYRDRQNNSNFDGLLNLGLNEQKKQTYPVVVSERLQAPYSIMLQDGSSLTPEQAIEDGARFYSSQESMVDAQGTINTAAEIYGRFARLWQKGRTTQEAAGLVQKDGKTIVITTFDAKQPVGSDGGTWFYTHYCMAYYLVHQYLYDTNFTSSTSKQDAINVLQVLENLYHFAGAKKQEEPNVSQEISNYLDSQKNVRASVFGQGKQEVANEQRSFVAPNYEEYLQENAFTQDAVKSMQ